MRQLWLLIGRVSYWLAHPAIAVFIKGSKRTRVVVAHHDSILLLQNWLGDGSWVLPGGGLHHGEAPETGALRELKEETGLELTDGRLTYLGEHVFRDKGFHFSYDLFGVELAELPPLKPQRFEVSDLTWMSSNEFNNFKLGDEVLEAIAAWSAKR